YSGGAEILRNQYEFKSLLDKLYAMDWVVYSKRTFKGAQEVFKYLGKYTHRIAISNKRILSMDSENVTFSAKDYRTDGKYRPMTISGEKFISRFLLHILPKGFVRIRYYGLLACRCKAQKMTLCRNLLGCEQYLSKLRGKTTAEKIKILYNHDICKCSKCGEPLITFRIDGRYMLC
nr:transposase [Clostridia bacterium]